MESLSPNHQTRRTRVLLSNYYGKLQNTSQLEDTNSEEKTTIISGISPPAIPIDPDKEALDIDGSFFNSERYLGTLLKEKCLDQLVHQDETLNAEIKSLDSDMKTLVYENYNKFLAATDTIKTMKSNVGNMEEEMKKLSSNMGNILESSNTINETLSENKQRLETLTNTLHLLKKFQFISELPAKLKQCKEMKLYKQAVHYYLNTRSLLEQYNHLPSFRTIQTESKETISSLGHELLEQFEEDEKDEKIEKNEKDEGEEEKEEFQEIQEIDMKEYKLQLTRKFTKIVDSCVILLELEYNPELIQEKFFSSRQRALDSSFQIFDVEKYHHLDIAAYSKILGSAIFHIFLTTSDHFQHIFSSSHGDRNILHEFIKKNFTTYIALIRKKMETPKNMKISSLRAIMEFIEGLEIIFDDIENLHRALSFIHGPSRIRDLVTTTGQNLVENLFLSLQPATKHLFSRLSSEIEEYVTLNSYKANVEYSEKQNLKTIIDRYYEELLAHVITIIKALQPLFGNEHTVLSPQMNSLYSKMIIKLQQYFLFLNITFLEIIETQQASKNPITSTFILALIGILQALDLKGLDLIIQKTQELEVDLSNEIPSNIDMDEMKRLFSERQQKCLDLFVQNQGRLLSRMMVKSMQTGNWGASKEPRDVRLAIELFVGEVKKVSYDLKNFFPLPEQNITHRRPSWHSHHPPHHHHPTHHHSRKPSNFLFDKKVDIFTPIESECISILVGIIKIGLKALFEATRLCTFDKFGFQQIQVDANFLDISLREFFETESVLRMLLENIVSNAALRCIDPDPMKQTIINKICEKKK